MLDNKPTYSTSKIMQATQSFLTPVDLNHTNIKLSVVGLPLSRLGYCIACLITTYSSYLYIR